MVSDKVGHWVNYKFRLIGMTKNRNNPLGAKNNDSTSEKLVIVKFYTPK